MELILVRHALPVRVDASPDGGPADPGLAARGVEQAARLPAALEMDDVPAVYSSPSRRALETAAPLVQALGAGLNVEPGIAEFDVDEPSYVPVEELKASGDPRWELLARGDLYSAGVDPVAFRARVVAAVERIAATHPGGRAVLFTHSGAINAYAGHVLGQERHIWFGPAYCSLTRIAAGRTGRRGVVSLNETGHVRDLL
ncbi:MAG: histidine phosphatase family protein [Actinobacteria bacterium]|nr:histidine phosphatase family protein [Actinomycetota bacterium]MCA1721782.1 histidine phosphatase family protein [Actinomycetota bacterium]